MRTNNILTLAVLVGIFCAAISLASGSTCEGGGVGVEASLSQAVIGVNDTTTMVINLTGNATSAMLFPVDVVLAMDCSGSMERYGTMIMSTSDVTLTTSYKKLGEFTIAEVTDVEVMLQIPIDIYYSKDQFSAYLKNKNIGTETTKKVDYSTTRWSGVAAGTYEVYAKLVQSDGTPGRTLAVELPPVRIDSAKTAAKRFVDLLKENDETGLVRFQSSGFSYKDFCTVKQALTTNKNMVKNNIDSLSTGGGTPMGEGLKVAIDHLDSNGRAGTEKAIIMLTDGWWNMGSDPMVQAERAAAKGYTVYMIGWGGVNVTALQLIAAKTGGRAYFPATEEDLITIYEELANVLSSISAKNVTLRIELSNSVTYTGDASRAPDQIIGNTLLWNVGTVSVDQSEVISFDVKPNAEGMVQINTENSKVTYENVCNEQGEVAVPILNVNVIRYPPEASLVSTTGVKRNESFKLDASASYDPDGYIVEYRWNFGDGTPDVVGNVLMINHSYNTSGNKTVTLTVVDNSGATDVKTITINVSPEDAGGVSGKVEWKGDHEIHGFDQYIGDSQVITATAKGIKRINTNETVNIAVYLYADGQLLNWEPWTLSDNSPQNVPVLGTWNPMTSGRHFISLQVRAVTGVEWVGPTNDPTAGVRVFIEKVT